MCDFSPAIIQIPRTLTHHNQIGYQTRAHWSELGELFDLKCLEEKREGREERRKRREKEEKREGREERRKRRTRREKEEKREGREERRKRREKEEKREGTETLTRMSGDDVNQTKGDMPHRTRPLIGMSDVLFKNEYEGPMVKTEGARDV